MAAEPYDETRHHTGSYRALLRGTDVAGLSESVQERLDDQGCAFGDGSRFVVDPIPRLIHGTEWDALAPALGQRVRALEAFVADVYGERRIVAEGVIPERVIAGTAHFDPRVAGLPVKTWITVAGLDLVRDEHGEFAVLEDNVRTPSGLAYLQAARDAVSRRVTIPAGRRLRRIESLIPALRRGLEQAAHVDDPFVVLLTDGSFNSAYWEHRTLAEALGVPLVTASDLARKGGRLCHAGRPVDVVYRRTECERLVNADGRATALGELLAGPLREGALVVANAFGTGVADDKLVHAYVEDMIRFYLGEEPGLRSVRTFDLSDPAVREEALDRIAEIVVKPRAGHGGQGVVIGPCAGAEELELTREAIGRAPEDFVAQELVMLSRHPTVAQDGLEPRHVDLRPFVVGGRVLPGGLTRVALEEGSMIVNSSRQGGAKDTWVLD